MIQHGTYHNGGYYLHKVMVEGRKFSAYFDRDGKMVDCEETTNFTSKVVRKKSILTELQTIGLRYLPKPESQIVGYLVPVGEKLRIACGYCKQFYPTTTGGESHTPVYRVNVSPYSAACVKCKTVLLDGVKKNDGVTPLELFGE